MDGERRFPNRGRIKIIDKCGSVESGGEVHDDPKPSQLTGALRSYTEFIYGMTAAAENSPFCGNELVNLAEKILMQSGGGDTSDTLGYSMFSVAKDMKGLADICQAMVTELERKQIFPPGCLRFELAGDSVLLHVAAGTCLFRHYERWRQDAGREPIVPFCMRANPFAVAIEQAFKRPYGTNLQNWAPFPGGEGCTILVARRPYKPEAAFSREEGSISFSGERTLLLPMSEYQHLIDELTGMYPELVKEVLYQSAFRTGVSMASKVAPMIADSVLSFRYLVEMFSKSGEGALEVVEFEPQTARGLVRGRNLAVAGRAAQMKLFRFPQVVDDNCAGRLAGYASGILGRRVTCEELRCTARGDSHCEFHLRPGLVQGESQGA